MAAGPSSTRVWTACCHRAAVARVEGVLFVEQDFVVVTEGNCDAALCVFGGRFTQGVFGDYEDGPRGRQLDCRT